MASDSAGSACEAISSSEIASDAAVIAASSLSFRSLPDESAGIFARQVCQLYIRDSTYIDRVTTKPSALRDISSTKMSKGSLTQMNALVAAFGAGLLVALVRGWWRGRADNDTRRFPTKSRSMEARSQTASSERFARAAQPARRMRNLNGSTLRAREGDTRHRRRCAFGAQNPRRIRRDSSR